MGFAVYLKKEYNGGFDLSPDQQSEVFMNSFIVHLIQITLILGTWKYAIENSGFNIRPASGLDMMVARFMASMMMHINVEKDVRNGIAMMKYACNHHDQFTNVYPSFMIGFLMMSCSFIVEINVMIILSSLPDILGVIMKYVSLAAIANIPRFYYNSLVEHKALSFGGLSSQ